MENCARERRRIRERAAPQDDARRALLFAREACRLNNRTRYIRVSDFYLESFFTRSKCVYKIKQRCYFAAFTKYTRIVYERIYFLSQKRENSPHYHTARSFVTVNSTFLRKQVCLYELCIILQPNSLPAVLPSSNKPNRLSREETTRCWKIDPLPLLRLSQCNTAEITLRISHSSLTCIPFFFLIASRTRKWTYLLLFAPTG